MKVIKNDCYGGFSSLGLEAGKAGQTAEDNPYPLPAQREEGKAMYVSTPHARWEHGRQAGEKQCPHCGGTGQRQ